MADNTENKVVAKLSLDVSTLMDQFKKIQDEFSTLKNGFNKSGENAFFTDAQGVAMSLTQKIRELNLQFKEGALSTKEWVNSLKELRNNPAYDFKRTNAIGIANDQTLRSAVIQAEQKVDQIYNSQIQKRMSIERGFDSWKKQQAIDYTSWWKQQLSERDNAVKSSFDQQMKLNDTLYQTNRITAQQYYNNLKRLDTSYDSYLNEEANKRIEILKRMYTTEEEMAKSNQTAIQKFFSGSKNSESAHINGFGMMNPLDMATMMTSFTVMNQVLQNVQQGLVQMGTAQAGLQQVFGENISSQNQLNTVTDQFISIAEKYGASVQDVLAAGKQWGKMSAPFEREFVA